jgi:hypothetical protein
VQLAPQNGGVNKSRERPISSRTNKPRRNVKAIASLLQQKPSERNFLAKPAFSRSRVGLLQL